MRKLLVVLLMTLAVASLRASQIVEAVVARVGDRIITRSDYLDRLQHGLQEIENTGPADTQAARKEKFKNDLLNEMIDDLLIKDRADRLGLTVTDEQVKQAVEQLKSQYGITSDEQFEQSLAQSGLTRAQMEKRLRDTLMMNQLFSRELRSRSQADEKELRRRYEREKERYRLPERAHIREIILLHPETGDEQAVRKQAEDIAAKARAGEDFAKLVENFSQAPSKKDQGDLGVVGKGELLPALNDAIFGNEQANLAGLDHRADRDPLRLSHSPDRGTTPLRNPRIRRGGSTAPETGLRGNVSAGPARLSRLPPQGCLREGVRRRIPQG